jgi:hypothetical protein
LYLEQLYISLMSNCRTWSGSISTQKHLLVYCCLGWKRQKLSCAYQFLLASAGFVSRNHLAMYRLIWAAWHSCRCSNHSLVECPNSDLRQVPFQLYTLRSCVHVSKSGFHDRTVNHVLCKSCLTSTVPYEHCAILSQSTWYPTDILCGN